MNRDTQHRLLAMRQHHARATFAAQLCGVSTTTVYNFWRWHDTSSNNTSGQMYYGERALTATERVYCPECHHRLTRAFMPFHYEGSRLCSAEPCAACYTRSKAKAVVGNDGLTDSDLHLCIEGPSLVRMREERAAQVMPRGVEQRPSLELPCAPDLEGRVAEYLAVGCSAELFMPDDERPGPKGGYTFPESA